jgi:hypothetical protein
MYRELMMVINSIQGTWTDVLNRSHTEGRNVDTPEKAIAIIDLMYGEELGEHTFEVHETEIYTISENPISPCVNCPPN